MIKNFVALCYMRIYKTNDPYYSLIRSSSLTGACKIKSSAIKYIFVDVSSDCRFAQYFSKTVEYHKKKLYIKQAFLKL